MTNNIKVTVISPAYNEAANLEELVQRVHKTLTKFVGKRNWEFIVVNDNSSDNSKVILEKLKKKYQNLRPVHHYKNRGQTGCFDTGFKLARGDIVITMDGDLEVHPEDIPLFLEKMKHPDVDVVNGIRTNRKHTFAINSLSRIYNILMFLVFQSPVYDAASNFTAFRSKFIKGINLKYNDHRYIIPIVQRRGAREFDEVIIHHDYRKSGISKYNAMKKFFFGFFELCYAWYRINVVKEYDRK